MSQDFGKAFREKLIEMSGASPDIFRGCTAKQIEEIRIGQGVSYLPDIYRQFLVEMGQGAGALYGGLDAHYPALMDLKTVAKNILEDDKDISYELPEDAFVFLIAGGQFAFFRTQDMEDDPAVFYYDEYGAPKQSCEHLSEFLTWIIREKQGIAAHNEFLMKHATPSE